MGNRHDFLKNTKNAVAARAGWLCSFTGCARATVGPSDESPAQVTKIGKAAHIAGAAPGPGSRRYDPSMTFEQRRDIGNAIWLCATHADLIDRDEAQYTVKVLQEMKRAREAAQAEAVRNGSFGEAGSDLLAIGPDIVCTGEQQEISADMWTLRLNHFLIGDWQQLANYIDGFAQLKALDRYVLSINLGDGREFSAAPVMSRMTGALTLQCPVASAFSRIDAQKLGSSMAMHPDTNDLFVDSSGNIARVSGLAALPQYIRSALSMQRGESVFAPKAGVRFFEYFEQYSDSYWLDRLMTLDVIRQAAVPIRSFGVGRHTPLQCVKRVRSFELLSRLPENNRLLVRADFEVQGVGHWQHDFSIYLPTRDQMAERARTIAERPELEL